MNCQKPKSNFGEELLRLSIQFANQAFQSLLTAGLVVYLGVFLSITTEQRP